MDFHGDLVWCLQLQINESNIGELTASHMLSGLLPCDKQHLVAAVEHLASLKPMLYGNNAAAPACKNQILLQRASPAAHHKCSQITEDAFLKGNSKGSHLILSMQLQCRRL